MKAGKGMSGCSGLLEGAHQSGLTPPVGPSRRTTPPQAVLLVRRSGRDRSNRAGEDVVVDRPQATVLAQLARRRRRRGTVEGRKDEVGQGRVCDIDRLRDPFRMTDGR